MEQLSALERRRRTLRIVLFAIILTTLPFYCAGILLWGTAERNPSGGSEDLVSDTPIGSDRTPVSVTPLPSAGARPSNTPFQFDPLQPTPQQFLPQPTSVPPPTATEFIPPLPTGAPTLTPRPTDTPRPTNTPQPTSTPLPLPSDTPPPTETPLPLPSDTPQPTPTEEEVIPPIEGEGTTGDDSDEESPPLEE